MTIIGGPRSSVREQLSQLYEKHYRKAQSRATSSHDRVLNTPTQSRVTTVDPSTHELPDSVVAAFEKMFEYMGWNRHEWRLVPIGGTGKGRLATTELIENRPTQRCHVEVKLHADLDDEHPRPLVIQLLIRETISRKSWEISDNGEEDDDWFVVDRDDVLELCGSVAQTMRTMVGEIATEHGREMARTNR